MGIAIAAFLLDFIITIILGIFTSICLKKYAVKNNKTNLNKFRLLLAGLSMIAYFIILFIPLVTLVDSAIIEKGNYSTFIEFEKNHGDRIPKNSSNIQFYSKYQGVHIIFELNEKDFLNWLKYLELEPQKIESSSVRVNLHYLNIISEISDGYTASKSYGSPDNSLSIYYDKKNSLCYYRYSSY
jgi:predicted PurR-regulated permease PerM